MTSKKPTGGRGLDSRVRSLTLGFTYLIALFVPVGEASACGTIETTPFSHTDIGQSATIFRLEPSPVADQGVRTMADPSMTRLAMLAGPFQSFQENRIAQDPNCGRWGGRDKVRHAAIFFATTLGLQLFIESTFNVSKTKAFLMSAAVGTLIGLGREYYDWKISDKNCFSEQDLIANTAGILGAGLVILISD